VASVDAYDVQLSRSGRMPEALHYMAEDHAEHESHRSAVHLHAEYTQHKTRQIHCKKTLLNVKKGNSLAISLFL